MSKWAIFKNKDGKWLKCSDEVDSKQEAEKNKIELEKATGEKYYVKFIFNTSYEDAYATNYATGGQSQPDEPSVQRLQDDLRALRDILEFGISTIQSEDETSWRMDKLLHKMQNGLLQTNYMEEK